MKILLLGEYSGLFNNLKEGLQKLNQEVVLASSGDAYKKFPSDVYLTSKPNRYLYHLDYSYSFLKNLDRLRDFDVVQVINPHLFHPYFPHVNDYILNKIHKINKALFLSGAGPDAIIWDYWINHKNLYDYSFVDGQREDDYSAGEKLNIMEKSGMLRSNIGMLSKFKGYIPIMFEYALPYNNYQIPQQTIPIPINIDNIPFRENKIKNKIRVFHGLNRYGVKGTKYIEEAFKILSKKYPNDLELVIKGRMPFNDYKMLLESSNIVIDQVLSYSLSMNSLFAMAYGKVVLGGNEIFSSAELGYDYNPSINIVPNANQIVECVERICDNRQLIETTGYTSRKFVEDFHECKKVAQKYLDFWGNNI